MNELLTLAVRAHGGLSRWNRLTTLTATASITGASRCYRLIASAGVIPDRPRDRTTFAMGAGSPTGHRRQSAFASP